MSGTKLLNERRRGKMTYGNVLKVEDVMKEEELEKKNKAKKQIPLRVSPALYAELMEWAEDDFRSLNGQIEYLLTECVKYRKGKKD